MGFGMMLLFEAIPALIGVMYACANICDYTKPTITKFVWLFCLPFLGMQIFIFGIPSLVFYVAGELLLGSVCLACIIISFFIVGTIENRMVHWC